MALKTTATASSADAVLLKQRFARRMADDAMFYPLFDHMPGVSFFAKDEKFRIVAANRHFYERFGFEKESDIIGQDDFTLFPTGLAEHFRRDDAEVLATGVAKLNIVELFFNRQRIPDWFITNKLPVLDRKGKVMGLMGTTQSYESKKQILQPFMQIDKAVNYIREHFRKKVSVEELAAMVHLSPRQLQRKFVEAFGSSPQAFIMKLRIQAACLALKEESAQISEVARAMGFADQSSFTQHFQRHLGMTPLRYLRQFRLRRI
ncbi:AraC family transcriptional regulator [Phragmitibacter flavus]|uniref:AraC family transcriptional regulator n=1 Tax=Phragmitibacter flavus TaxID=2576071 RepID=A0A5R8KGF7_9BACT|nr:AraC family transcriptional regulator [Phragmitibacter flavus]TLD71393.1 AraC family transcriptional regulator [Phragmitibacter flavus]